MAEPYPTGKNSYQSPQEQEFRQKLTEGIAVDSAGSVALHTTRDFTPAEKHQMIAAQEQRGGKPAEILNSPRGGWGNYGEREMPKLSVQNGEHLVFVDEPEGTTDVRYSFKQPEYSDDTGRPGSYISVAFRLPTQRAAELRTAVGHDPSFFNDVLRAQMTAIGIDTTPDRKRWLNMEPHYYSNFKKTVEDRDRVLTVDRLAQDGTVIDSEDLVYGEDRSLGPMLNPEDSLTPAVAEANQPSSTEPYSPSEVYKKSFAEEMASEREFLADALKITPIDKLITLYETYVENAAKEAEAADELGEPSDKLWAAYDVCVAVREELIEKQKQDSARDSSIENARGAVDSARDQAGSP